MIIKEFAFKLKDGREAVIRSPRLEDHKNLVNYLEQAAGETNFLLTTPEECAKYTEEYEKVFIQTTNDSPNAVMLLCLVNNRIVGTSRVEWSTHFKTRHRARVGIAVLKDYWGQGIGSQFFKELIRVAENNPEITQMELEFIEGNERAKALYEKFGFKVYGSRPNSIRQKDGSLVKEFFMLKEINR